MLHRYRFARCTTNTDIFRKIILALLLSSLTVGCARSPNDAVLRDTAEKAILPLHEAFLADTLALAQRAKQFCENEARQPADIEALRHRWIGAINSWEAIQPIQFGPVTEDNQAWKVQFWPDRKNLIARKTEQFVASDAAISLRALREASVVIQGLSAIEYLLYDSPAKALLSGGEQGKRYCDHLQAAAENSRSVADFLHRSWHPEAGNYLATWAEPGEANLDFPDHKASLAALLETLVYGLERIKRDKLERPLGLAGNAKANPYLLEWWRSRQSRDAILINLHSLQLLFNAKGGFGLSELLNESGSDLGKQAEQHFNRAVSLAAGIDANLFDKHENPETRESSRKLHKTLGELIGLLKRDIPQTLGITLGFNANDGD